MSDALPPCPECSGVYTYKDGALLVCPECAHEWNPDMPAAGERIYKDANGNVLVEGDMVTLIKDLKVQRHIQSRQGRNQSPHQSLD